jgi:glycine/D-amino acid oxidase-like deaminating enzyme
MDVIVVGGGIVGLNIALSLQSKGLTVTLIERERNHTSASYGNAGHIAIEQVEPLASMAMIRFACSEQRARRASMPEKPRCRAWSRKPCRHGRGEWPTSVPMTFCAPTDTI